MAIRDYLKNLKNFPRYDGEIGLEIETETMRPYDAPEFKYWVTHPDGSLRNFGVEYVLRQPVLFEKEFDAALEEWADKTSKIKFIKDTITTSVHLHLNILNESFKTFGNFLTLYTMYENLLIRYSGPDRLSNLFCLPICDAEETYRNIVNMFKGVAIKNYKSMAFTEGSVKYAALNLSSILNYGSIEMRSFRGETDIEQIRRWVEILYSIMQFSRQDVSPREIMNLYREDSEKLMNGVFKGNRKLLKIDEEKELVEKNVFYAASIAYSVRNWNELDMQQEVPKFAPKAKERNDAAMKHFGQKYADLQPGEAEYIIELLHARYLQSNNLVDNRGAVVRAEAEREQPRVRLGGIRPIGEPINAGARIPQPPIQVNPWIAQEPGAVNAGGNHQHGIVQVNPAAEILDRPIVAGNIANVWFDENAQNIQNIDRIRRAQEAERQAMQNFINMAQNRGINAANAVDNAERNGDL